MHQLLFLLDPGKGNIATNVISIVLFLQTEVHVFVPIFKKILLAIKYDNKFNIIILKLSV